MIDPQDIVNAAINKCDIKSCKDASHRDLPDSIVKEHRELMSIGTEIRAEHERIELIARKANARADIMWVTIKELFPEISQDSRLFITDDSTQVYSANCQKCLYDHPEKLPKLMGLPAGLGMLFGDSDDPTDNNTEDKE